MAAAKTIKVPGGMKIEIYIKSFKLDVYHDVVYFTEHTTSDLLQKSTLFDKLPLMLKAAYDKGKEDATEKIHNKYADFMSSMIGG